MKCIKIDDNNFITHPTHITKSCLDELSAIQGRTNYNPIIPKMSLTPLNDEQITIMQSFMSQGKGLNGDGISDTWIANTNNPHIINDIWKPEIFKLLPKIGRAQLIPLNKVWPQIPTKDQFRPITILSPLFKWLELRFIDDLNNYQSIKMNKEQVGFVPTMSTLTNIRRLIMDIKSYKSNDKKCLIFIDFKSAFNTIDREILYDILHKKNILKSEEIDFLKALHSHIHYKCDGQIYYYKNGVTQGSPLSPALFNIYFEDALSKIKIEYPNIKMYAYADDIAFLINYNQVFSFLDDLTKISKDYKLIINKKKVE